jgi:hypothetical protein
MISLADEALVRRGRMIKAVEHMSRAEAAYEAVPFVLPADLTADASR